MDRQAGENLALCAAPAKSPTHPNPFSYRKLYIPKLVLCLPGCGCDVLNAWSVWKTHSSQRNRYHNRISTILSFIIVELLFCEIKYSHLLSFNRQTLCIFFQLYELIAHKL